ncbi:MAG: AsmA-like C-terminal region-containing protein [Candidatus Pseudobacter hemicellulosilyticus]|uniref:AsmA-like C-terminal region-containing protein n=1 Tax=Candidatus Pseudobacter hemicellulosilyticus TaxID=3121375 RepID=A0AAJ5WU57_9BACT|nr:MAG: AsmA-like C-terminal region-containing protein [Pseudobacter sp.]
MRKWLVKGLKITGVSVGSLLLLMFLLPFLFPNFVEKKIKSWANNAIVSDVDFSRARLSFFHHFPSLTLTLDDFILHGSPPFRKDTLVAANEIALGIDLGSIFSSSLNINQIFLSDGRIEIKVNKEGLANYNVYKSDSVQSASVDTDSGSASLRLENIHLDRINLTYRDRSIPMAITAKGLHYAGKGDLSKAIFDLYSEIEVDTFRFSYDGETYISNKQVRADLITKINTHSLALLFEKNDLMINQLPVQLSGKFEFLADGYDMDFKLVSRETDLHDVFTAFPQSVLQWLETTDVKGYTEMNASLKGKYSAATNTSPDLQFNMKIRNGSIAHKNAPLPAKNIFLNMETRLPSLNMDSLYVNIDSVFFNIDQDRFSAHLQWKGMQEPAIKAKMNADLDLDKWNKAFGMASADLKGRLRLDFKADGLFARGPDPHSLRKDTVITHIPAFTLTSSLTDGYFKYSSLPQAVQDIGFQLDAGCADGIYDHTQIALNSLQAKVLSNFIKGHFHIDNIRDFPVEGSLQTVFHLADVKQFYPLDSLDLAGDLRIDITTKGKYNPAKKLFPVTEGQFLLKDGSIQTKYYPSPIEKIQVEASVTDTKGTLSDLKVAIRPISFELDQQQFLVQANLQNFNDLEYNITSNGVLDLGKLYRLFAVDGYNVKGFIQTDLALRGRQSDAMAGRYGKLYGKGTMKVRDIALTSELFPQPFFVNTGLFRFDQDKMWFEAFTGQYGKSKLELKGHLNNVLGYALQPDQPLRGDFELTTPYFLVDEWMVFAGDSSSTPEADAGNSGVVMIPANLELVFKAAAGKVEYNGLLLKDFKGQVELANGKLQLKETGFNLADAPISMEASYASTSPLKAVFDYHVKADTLNVKKAYNQIPIFREMAPAAAGAEGIISLDYSLSGRLDANMMPVYPSLKGGGDLVIQKVKMKGFKLMNAVSASTGKEDIKDPDLSKVTLKTKIANNIITIERVKMKVAGFRPRFEGQVSFDGKFNLTGRLGLPPLGIIGIPFTVTGTRDNPKVKLRKGKETDELEETEDEEVE